MSAKITTCIKCNSLNIKETNPEQRKIMKSPLCTINCICQECGFVFNIKSWTEYGRKKVLSIN